MVSTRPNHKYVSTLFPEICVNLFNGILIELYDRIIPRCLAYISRGARYIYNLSYKQAMNCSLMFQKWNRRVHIASDPLERVETSGYPRTRQMRKVRDTPRAADIAKLSYLPRERAHERSPIGQESVYTRKKRKTISLSIHINIFISYVYFLSIVSL